MKTAPRFAVIAKALVRTALWFCVSNLLVAVLAAQCTSVTQVPNGIISSGTNCYSNNDTLTAAGVTINGSASVSFVGGRTVHLTPGFRATAGTAGTTFHAWVETGPSVTSIFPSSGSGLSQQFTWTVSSPSGYSNIAHVYALFNTSASGANGCSIFYSRGANSLFLANDSGTAWTGGFYPGTAYSASNSYCTIYGTGSSVSASGNQLSVTVNVAFQSSTFSGTKNSYLNVYDSEGLYTGFQQMGTWTVGGGAGFSTIRISAGGPYTDSLGQYWAADYGYLQSSGTWPTTAAISGTSDQRLYQTERYNSPNLVYQFGVPNGNYTVTLKFAEIYDTAAGQRYQNIALNGTTVLTGLDVWTAAGGPNRAYDLSYPVSVTDGRLTITLTCTSPNNSAEVNAIQIEAAGTPQQYSLTTAVSPSGSGTISPGSGWYNSGSVVQVSANASSGFVFSGFSGSLTGGSPGYVTMNSNKSVTATFAQTAITQTITSVPTGLSLTVDGVACAAPCVRQWQAGSNHTISSATQSGGSGTQYLFTSWSDGGASTHTITTPSSAAIWSASFNTQYYLTTVAGTGGSITPASNWFNSGAGVAVNATPTSGYSFTGFSGGLTGTTTPQSPTMSGPVTVTANFSSGSGFTLSPLPTQYIVPGMTESASATETVTPYGGFNQNVTFSYATWPSGLSATFDPSSVGPNGSTRVAFTAAEGTAPGTYSVTLQASGGGVQQVQSLNMTVVDATWVNSGFLTAMDDGTVYAYFTSYFIGPDADLLSSRIVGVSYTKPNGQRSDILSAGWQTGPTPVPVRFPAFSLPAVGFGTYGFVMDVYCCQTQGFDLYESDGPVIYPTPTLSDPLSPNSSPPGSRVNVAISGQGLGASDEGFNVYKGITSLNISGNGLTGTLLAPQSVQFLNATGTSVSASLDATNAKPGTYQVSLTVFGYTTNSLPFYVYDVTPYVSSVTLLDPATLQQMEALPAGGQAIAAIAGSNFGPAPGGGVNVCTTGAPQCVSSDVSAASPSLWSDTAIRVLLTASPTSSGTYDLQVRSSGLGGNFVPAPGEQDTARGQVQVGTVSLVLSRVDLMHVQATGSPAGGQFTDSVRAVSGENIATIGPNITVSPSTSTTTLVSPSNMSPRGEPAPGGLAQFTVTYQAPSGASQSRQFTVPTFGMSCYYTTTEQEWGTSPNSCGTTRIYGITYSGTYTDKPNLPGTYCKAFLEQVKLQGSGILANGTTKIQYEPATSTWNTRDQITGADLTAVLPDQTVARDRAVIGGRSSVQVALDGIGTNLTANDIGGRIAGYRLDLYRGAGPGVCANYPNPIVVAACSPGSAKCPASSLQ